MFLCFCVSRYICVHECEHRVFACPSLDVRGVHQSPFCLKKDKQCLLSGGVYKTRRMREENSL